MTTTAAVILTAAAFAIWVRLTVHYVRRMHDAPPTMVRGGVYDGCHCYDCQDCQPGERCDSCGMVRGGEAQ
jgi:hypothetical protein